MLGNLSYRYKTPIALSAVVLATVVALTTVGALRSYREARGELLDGARQLAAVLADSLTEELRNDALWAAYGTVKAALGEFHGAGRRPTVVVLNQADQIFVSSLPRRFPVLTQLGEDPHGRLFLSALAASRSAPAGATEIEGEGQILLATALSVDDQRFGTLMMAYTKDALLPGLYATLRSNLVVAAAILLVLLPSAWYWGKRLTGPLIELAGRMERLPEGGETVPKPIADAAQDEIRMIERTFDRMAAGLAEKREIERRMVADDRLAAIGRLAAGVAHEINNPLAGMLTAVDTFKRHGHADRMTRKTVSLLERGLLQIKDTVAALLVETRRERRALTVQDVEDVRTLIAADLQRRRVVLDWRPEITEQVALPATEIRQILLNLLLNAVHGAHQGGRVGCRIETSASDLRLIVSNDGDPIPDDMLGRIFEPFAGGEGEGTGLGLWVCYQATQQLDGRIQVSSDAEQTRFEVTLPITAGRP